MVKSQTPSRADQHLMRLPFAAAKSALDWESVVCRAALKADKRQLRSSQWEKQYDSTSHNLRKPCVLACPGQGKNSMQDKKKKKKVSD